MDQRWSFDTCGGWVTDVRRRIRLSKVFWSAFSHLPKNIAQAEKSGTQVSSLTSEIYVCLHARVHFREDLLKVITDGRQDGSVCQEGTPACPQGNVTEQARLTLTPQLAQHVGAVWHYCLCDTSSATRLLWGTDKTEKDRSKYFIMGLCCMLCVCEKALPGDKRESKWEWVRRCELKCVRCRKRRLSP